MNGKICITLFVLIWILTACSSDTTVELATPLPSPIVISESATATATATSTRAATLSTPSTASSTRTPVTGFDCQSIREIPLRECQALVALYGSTDGANWEDNSNWLVTNAPCSWYGVICQEGHVIELQLFYNQLNGSLPAELGEVTHLENLYLDGNQLSGPLPPEFGNLAKLKLVRLGGNQFSSIPADMGNLTSLVYLDLWGNQLSGNILGELGNLSNLQELTLGFNQLTGNIPAELGDLVNLGLLDLSHNQLSGSIPAELGNMSNLGFLDLSYNQMTGSIPAELGELSNLNWLDLSYNQLTGAIPIALTQAPMLERRLWGNLLDGTVLASKGINTTVEYQGVRFVFNSTLAESVWPDIVAAQPRDEGGPAWDVKPEHVRFTFTSQGVPDSFQIREGIGVSGQPQILIYPAEEFRAMSEVASRRIESLQEILSERPMTLTGEIPFLPLINAAQVFQAQIQYLDFQSGSGVRFITQYSQEAIPIINQSIFYTFQGLSNDGAYYIAALFPVSAPVLPDELELSTEESISIGENYATYLSEIVQALESLPDSEYEPDLTLLDEIIQTLEVK
jgi:Leucine-rich repeat (LRR) protein